MTQKERENFLRNAILIVDLAKDSVTCLLDLDLRNKHLTFEQFLNQNQHEIYHLCYNSRCCQCPRGYIPPRGGSRVLYPLQLEILYDKSLKRTNHTHGRSPDICCSLAKTGIVTSILDLTLVRCLLVNFCTDVFWYSCLTVQSLTLENFLNQNKHILYHLWQNNSSCCQCQPNAFISSSQQIFDQRQWTALYSANLIPCAIHRKRPNTGVPTSICAFAAKSGITVQILDPHVNKLILDTCCVVRKAVELIVQRRNYVYGHANEAKISDSDYLQYKNEIGNGLIEIARVCGNESEVRHQLLDLQKRTLDETLLIQYQTIMLIHVSRNEELKNKVTEIQRQLQTHSKHLRNTVDKAITVKLPKVLKRSVTSIDDRLGLVEKSAKDTNLLVKRIETKQAENPKKLRFLDHTRKEIDQHIKERTFVETRAIRKFMTMHSDKDVFLITGSAGKGKSRNGLDILRQLGGKFPTYDVVKVSNLHTVDKILNKDSRTLLLLEDVFGKTNCRYSDDNDRYVLDILQAYINSGNVKVIFTIRSVVKKSLQYLHLFSSHRIFKGFEEINLNSSQFEMTKMEKERLLENYCSKNNIKIVHVGENENYYDETVLDKKVTVKINEATFTNIVNTDTYLGFPESCYMFTSNRPLTRLGIQFFKHPTRFLNQEIDNLRRNGESNMKDRTCYITLVYILLSSNTLDKTVFDRDKAASIFRSCYNRDSFLINSEIIGAAEEMTGSYLTYNTETSVFQFQHQTIFESVMLSYYNVDPNSVLTMIDFEMLREVVKLSNYLEKEEEIKMIIPKQFYGNLAKRLFQIFHFQFRHMPSNFIKVLCDSDLMTQIDADFITQLGEHFIEASNHDIYTIITYEGKSEEVVFCLLAAVLWYSTIKDWKTEDIKVILHSLKITLLSETRSNVNNACKRTIVAAFLYSCDKKNANDIIEFFLQTIDELEISFDINRCFQDVVDRQNQRTASCILQHFSKKIDIVEVILETEREKLQDLIDIFTASFSCSTVGSLIHDRARLIKWIFSSVDPKHFNMTKAVETAGDKRLLNIVDWLLEKFNYKLFDCQILLKEACGKGWENVVRRFLQEDAYQPFDLRCIMSAACQHSWYSIVKQLLQNSNLVTFDVNVLLTDACKKDDFEIVKSLIVYIGDKKTNFNDDIKYVFEALQSNQIWSLSDFCTNFVKVLLKHIDSDKKLIQHEDLKSLNTINLLLDSVSETTFNFHSAVAEAISNDIIHKENVLQLFMDSNHVKQIRVSLLLLEACRGVNCKFVTWLLKNIDNESLKVTTSFNESCTYGRLQIIKIMIQYADHKLLNFTSAFLNCVKEEWRHHNDQNEEVLKFLLNTIDHSLFDLNKIAKETIILGQEDVMKILLNNVDIQSFETEQVVDYACEQGLLGIVEIFWKSENKEQINVLSAVNRALKGNKLDVVNWFREHINVGIMNVCVPLDLPIINENTSAIKLIKYLFENEYTFKIYIDEVIEQNRTDLLEWLYYNINNITSHLNTIITDAIFKGRKDVLLWIVQNVDKKFFDMKSTTKHLLEFGFLEIVAWILQNVDPKQIAMNEACCIGFLDSFNWMQYNVVGALLNIKTVINIAIYQNNFETVKWMILNNDHTLLDIQEIMVSCCTYTKSFSEAKFIIENVNYNVLDTKEIMNKACRLGNLFIVKSILEIIDPVLLDIKTASREALYEGRLDVVKYLLSNVDQKALDIAKLFNEAWRCSQLEIVKYMIENLDHILLDIKESVNKALKLHRIDILESILRSPNEKQQGTNTTINASCGTDYYDMVKWICDNVDHSLPDINVAISAAYELGNLDMIKLLFHNVEHTHLLMRNVVYTTCEKGHLEILNWILETVGNATLHINTVLNIACRENNINIVKYILDKLEHKVLEVGEAVYEAISVRNIEMVKCLLDKVDHNLIDFKKILKAIYIDDDCLDYYLPAIEVIFENVDLRLLDVETVMYHSCKFHKYKIVKYILDNVDHNRVDFKKVLKLFEDDQYLLEYSMFTIELIVEYVDWKLLDLKTVMIIACTMDNLDIVKRILEKEDHSLLDMNRALHNAFQQNNLDIVEYILGKMDHNLLIMKTAMTIACTLDNINIVTLILDKVNHEMLDMSSAMTAAIKCRSFEIVKFIYNRVNNILLDIRAAFNEACKIGFLEIVIFLLENVEQSQLDLNHAMIKACRGSNDETVKFLFQRFGGTMFDTKSAMNNACRYGNIYVIKWLWSNNNAQLYDMKSALINACISGKETVVEWLLNNVDQSQFDIQVSITETFVNRNNVTNVVITLLKHSNRSLVNLNNVVVEACAIGNVEIVGWLLRTDDRNLVDINQALYSVLNIKSKITENDSEYNNSITLEKRSLVMWVLKKYSLSLFDMNNTVKEICRNGWIDILQWIWRNPQDHSLEMGPAINVACVNGHKDLVEWALSNIDVKSLDTETLMNECCGNGLLTVAKWMWENIEHSRLNIRTAMNDACAFCRIDTVQWILENVDVSLLDTRNILNEASKHGWVCVVTDLLKDANIIQHDNRSTLSEACVNGHLDIVEYLFTKFGKDICDIESILPGVCSNPLNKEVAKFLINQFKNQLRLFANVMPPACGFGWTEVVEMLLEDINHTEIKMKGPLLNACKKGEFDVVKIILNKVDHSHLDIAEAFIVVCTRGWDEIARFLLDELDHSAFDMKSALIEASRSGEEDIVQLLFQKVKPEKFDIQMALDAASQNHMHENIVYQLLQRNCSATFELDRLKTKALEHDWPKVLSIIRKCNSEQNKTQS